MNYRPLPQGRRCRMEEAMRIDEEFVAAALEGIEDTLHEVIERLEGSELRAGLGALQQRVKVLRISIESPVHEVLGGREPDTTAGNSERECVE